MSTEGYINKEYTGLVFIFGHLVGGLHHGVCEEEVYRQPLMVAVTSVDGLLSPVWVNQYVQDNEVMIMLTVITI